MQKKAQLIHFGLAAAAGMAALFADPTTWSSLQTASLTTQAQARIGRPLTPGSIAGVNRRVGRRTARRAYYGAGAALGTAAAVGAAGAYLGNQYYNSYPGQYYGSYPGQYYGAAYGGYPVQGAPAAYSGPYASAAATGTSEWCAARYRSYNPATGTFLGYDGQYHACP